MFDIWERPVIVGIHHGGVTVADLEPAIDHVATLSEWTQVHRMDADHPLLRGLGVAAGALLTGPNAFIEIVEAPAGPKPQRRTVAEPGITHLSIQLPDMAAKNRHLVELGIERHADPIELGTGFSYLYVRDAEHNVVEIEGARHAPEGLAPWFSHVGVATVDGERLRSFYEAVLGSPAIGSARLEGMAGLDAVTALTEAEVTMTWVPAANANVEVLQFHHPPTGVPEHRPVTIPGVGHLCFEVDDVEAEVVRWVAAGAGTVSGVAMADGVSMARLSDPDGNLIELVAFQRKDDPLSLRNVEAFDRYRAMDALLAERTGR